VLAVRQAIALLHDEDIVTAISERGSRVR